MSALSALKEEIVAFLRKHQQWATRKEIAAALGKDKLRQVEIAVLDQLLEEDRLEVQTTERVPGLSGRKEYRLKESAPASNSAALVRQRERTGVRPIPAVVGKREN